MVRQHELATKIGHMHLCCISRPLSVPGGKERQISISLRQRRPSTDWSRGAAGAWACRAPCAGSRPARSWCRRSSTGNSPRWGGERARMRRLLETALQGPALQDPSVSPEKNSMRFQQRKAEWNAEPRTVHRTLVRIAWAKGSLPSELNSLIWAALNSLLACRFQI